MMPPRLRLNGHTRMNRIEMTERVREAIGSAYGWILEAHLFSNVSISLTFEIRRDQMPALLEALLRTGLQLHDDSIAALKQAGEELEALSAEAREQEVTGTLQITFIHDDPDLRREIPSVPG